MSKYVSSIPTVLSFDHERMLNFVKYFFCIFSSDHIIFILHSIKLVCHFIDLHVVPSLPPKDKSRKATLKMYRTGGITLSDFKLYYDAIII